MHILGDSDSIVKEGMGENLLQSWSFCWVQIEDFSDQIFGVLGDLNVLGKAIDSLLDLLIGHLYLWSLEGRLAYQKGIEDHAEGPDVHLIGMTLLTHEDLRGQIVGSSTDSVPLLCVEFQSGGKAKVSQFYLQFVIEEEISQF